MSESDDTYTPLDDDEQIKQLSSECISLSDDFNKFSEECAFLCDAFAAVTREPDNISPQTGEGIRHLSCWLKEQAENYRERIEQLHQSLSALAREL
ncbi:hypothetical protein SG34_013850 [Thalassomonas viridans]|uniref:Uncharacterized protein n=1 Tax=Thalassomonas viridans TaxID=137584 RepID=A0AAE9Z7V2_9GAMM|nr:hypothetical protein [Thalassomonas viridans]WDE07867.1 hypothetical protein SG34_013850 [Thalassomonas viridans]